MLSDAQPAWRNDTSLNILGRCSAHVEKRSISEYLEEKLRISQYLGEKRRKEMITDAMAIRVIRRYPLRGSCKPLPLPSLGIRRQTPLPRALGSCALPRRCATSADTVMLLAPQGWFLEEQGRVGTTMRAHVSSTKPTLHNMRQRQYFDISALAERAGVDVSVLHRMLNRQPVQRYQAELVLTALTDELGEDYTLDNVDILLFSEANKQEP
jgi:hypothetical protein